MLLKQIQDRIRSKKRLNLYYEIKLEIMETIIKLKKEDVNIQLLEIIKNSFSSFDNEIVITIKAKKHAKHSLKAMTISEYNKRLELSEQAVKEGKIYTQEQVLNQINLWKQKTSL